MSKVNTVVTQLFNRSQIPADAMRVGMVVRVSLGIACLLPLGLVVLLLLSSADAVFGEIVLQTFHTILDAVSWLWLLKLAMALCLTIALLSIGVGWSGSIEYKEVLDSKAIDGLVASIVLGGLLIIYVAFLSLQVENLVVGELPENYREAELMAKSGFWQLFLLAVLNVGLFFLCTKKLAVLLNGFCVRSLLHRVC